MTAYFTGLVHVPKNTRGWVNKLQREKQAIMNNLERLVTLGRHLSKKIKHNNTTPSNNEQSRETGNTG